MALLLALAPALALVTPGPQMLAPARALAPTMMSPETDEATRASASAWKNFEAKKLNIIRPVVRLASGLVEKVNNMRLRNFRKTLAVEDALLTASLRAAIERKARKGANTALAGWEDTVLPSLPIARGRDLAEDSWEARLLPAIEMTTSRRDLAEVGWEDRLLPPPSTKRLAQGRDLSECSWEEHVLPPSAVHERAGRDHHSLSSWERLIG